jgi:hypothetical protein
MDINFIAIDNIYNKHNNRVNLPHHHMLNHQPLEYQKHHHQ